ENNGDRAGGCLGRQCCGCSDGRDHHSDLAVNQIGGQRRQSIIVVLRPAILDGDVRALDEALLLQALAEGAQTVRVRLRQRRMPESDDWHRRLLRASREWPRRRRTAQQRYELASFHVWMAPAWQEKM